MGYAGMGMEGILEKNKSCRRSCIMSTLSANRSGKRERTASIVGIDYNGPINLASSSPLSQPCYPDRRLHESDNVCRGKTEYWICAWLTLQCLISVQQLVSTPHSLAESFSPLLSNPCPFTRREIYPPKWFYIRVLITRICSDFSVTRKLIAPGVKSIIYVLVDLELRLWEIADILKWGWHIAFRTRFFRLSVPVREMRNIVKWA